MDSRVHGSLQARILEWVAFPFSRGPSQSRDWTQVSHTAGDSLPAKPPGKPKNTGVASLSLLQLIFLTQESNQGLLHCRSILYQLSYQGSPKLIYEFILIRVSLCNFSICLNFYLTVWIMPLLWTKYFIWLIEKPSKYSFHQFWE